MIVLHTDERAAMHDVAPGPVALRHGGEAWWTGRVAIGARHGEPGAAPRALSWGARRNAISADAERIQSAYLAKPTRRSVFAAGVQALICIACFALLGVILAWRG